MKTPIKNRYDILFVYDCKDGNPNGDPDADNMPRIDTETEQGLVSDVCIKRKIRDYVNKANQSERFNLFVQSGNVLNNCVADVCKDTVEDVKNISDADTKSVVTKLCDKYFDIRTFGAVLSTGLLKGQVSSQVKGPVQISFSRSIDPISTMSITMTRNCVTDEKEKNSSGQEIDNTKGRTMGSKHIIPYGAYVCKIHINANDAERTGFSEEDFDHVITSLSMMFDNDKSSARNQMATQKLIVFKHNSKMGNAPSNKLFDAVSITKKDEIEFPRSFSDYDVSIDMNSLEKWKNVEMIEIV